MLPQGISPSFWTLLPIFCTSRREDLFLGKIRDAWEAQIHLAFLNITDNMNITDATNKKQMHLSSGNGNFSTKHKDAV